MKTVGAGGKNENPRTLPKHLTILESGGSVVSSIGRSCAMDQLHFNKTIVEIMKIAESVFIVLVVIVSLLIWNTDIHIIYWSKHFCGKEFWNNKMIFPQIENKIEFNSLLSLQFTRKYSKHRFNEFYCTSMDYFVCSEKQAATELNSNQEVKNTKKILRVILSLSYCSFIDNITNSHTHIKNVKSEKYRKKKTKKVYKKSRLTHSE